MKTKTQKTKKINKSKLQKAKDTVNKFHRKKFIKNVKEMAQRILKRLPSMEKTGLSKDLRKIAYEDPRSNDKNLVIWYGCPRMNDVTKLLVSLVNGKCGVANLSEPIALWGKPLADEVAEILNKGLSLTKQEIQAKNTAMAIAKKNAAAIKALAMRQKIINDKKIKLAAQKLAKMAAKKAKKIKKLSVTEVVQEKVVAPIVEPVIIPIVESIVAPTIEISITAPTI